MIARSGRSGVPIKYTALRPADRLHEALTGPDEHPEPGEGALCAVRAPVSHLNLESIREAVGAWDRDRLLDALRQALPEYTPA